MSLSTHSHHKSHEHRKDDYHYKVQGSKESQETSTTTKDDLVKSRSETIRKLIKEKQQEKEHAQKREQQQKEAKEKSKNSFRIPKKKPDVEKLINSLFDDTETKSTESDVSLDKKDNHRTEKESSDKKNSSSSASSHKEKHSLPSSNNLLDKSRDTPGNATEKPLSSTHSHKSHSSHTSSSSSSKHSEHKSGLSADTTRTSSASKDQKNRSSSEVKSSSKSRDSEHSGKDSSSTGTKHSSSHSSSSTGTKHSSSHSSSSTGTKHSSSHSSSSKSHSSSSSKLKESSSSNSQLKLSSSSAKSELKSSSSSSTKPELKTSSTSSTKPELKTSSLTKDELKISSSSTKDELKISSSSTKDELKISSSSKPELKASPPSAQSNALSPRSAGTQSNSSDQLPIVLNKHHLHPIVERQVSSTGLSEKEKILARLQAIKQRTLEAIHKENSGKRRFKGEKSHRKSKTEVKHDDKTKSVEIVRDIVSSDEEDIHDNGVPSALDIMLSDRNAKLEKEKITRMAKQAWERATKKDTGDSDIVQAKKKHRSSNKDKSSTHKHKSSKDDRKSNHKRTERSVSPHNSRKSSPKPKKPVIVRRSNHTGAPPMDFKAILAMAEKKQKETPKSVTAIPRKKKEEDKRPLTQDEKDRIERKKSKEYQDWLKFGGKPPSTNDISDDEEEEERSPKHSVLKSVDKRLVSSHPASTDKHKAPPGSSKSFNKNALDKERSGQQLSTNGNSNNKLRNITINENVLVCGPAASSDDEGSPDRTLNPFDRIMGKKRPAAISRSGIPVKKGHFDDSDAEYDSDMDDFIDDGEGDEPNYSQEIKKLFGYDKSKYKYERDEDLSGMEANYSTVMMEEKRSAKLGLMEDLEDIKKEQEELKRKAMMKKRK